MPLAFDIYKPWYLLVVALLLLESSLVNINGNIIVSSTNCMLCNTATCERLLKF